MVVHIERKMTTFIKNLNIFLKTRKIKNSYISLVTGWEKSKVSRILNGDVTIRMDDAEVLAASLGKDVLFFLNDDETVYYSTKDNEPLTFYTDHSEKYNKKIASDLLDMFRFYDALTNL